MKTYPQPKAKFKWRKNQMFKKNVQILTGGGSASFQGVATGPSTSGAEPTDTPTQSPELDREALIARIKAPLTFQAQMQTLISTLRDGRLEVEANRELIFNDLSQALASVFPSNSIHFFGSSVTGLDTQGSDLDVYLANVKQKNKPEIAILKTIRSLLFKCRNFCDVLLISGAKVPIIKCIHTKTQICCDLNIKNKLSVSNSNLVKYYLDLDERFRILMQFVKFWAETCKIKKVNFFSGYSLYLLVIFYLQQEPFNLPSVQTLQEQCLPDIVDGWNCAFKPISVSLPSRLQNISILDLLRDFFSFYANFDYFNYVVCPYLGRKLHKLSFIKKIPGGFPSTLKFEPGGGISIQDPFELDRDVSSCIPPGVCGRFGMLCRDSIKLMSGHEKEMMFKLFNLPPFYKSVHFNVEKPDVFSNEKWSDMLKTIAQQTLEDIMNFSCEPKIAVEPKISYMCVPKQYVFTDRFKIMKNLPEILRNGRKEIEIEKAVTDCIVKYLPKGKDPPKLQIVLNVLMPQNLKSSANIEFLVKAKCKQFPHFGQFFLLKFKAFIAEEIFLKKEKEPLSNLSDCAAVDSQISASSKMFEHRKENSEDRKCTSERRIDGNEEQSIDNNQNGSIDIDNLDDTLILKDDVEIDEEIEEEEDEEEDVPANFFDDFDEDFMDGLDIVDAWDEGRIQEDKDNSPQKKHSPIRYISPERNSDRKRSKSDSQKNQLRSKSIGQSPKAKLGELRRDPKKTKRDIDRDKQKIAKDKEKKIVSDKLNLVETGLVVPGMEMEVDIDSIIPNNRPSLQEVNNRKATPDKLRRRVSGSRDSKEYYRRSSTGRELVRRRSSSREHVRKRYSRTPPSYRRARERSRPPRHRSRKRSSSRDSNVSERELWIRTRKRSRSRPSRDSPKRKSKSRKYEEEKKRKSFLEEIREKLNEVRPAPIVVQYTHPASSAHVPMNPVGQYFPNSSHPVQQQYDESFFIGDGYQVQNNFNLGTANIPSQSIAPLTVPVNSQHVSPGLPIAEPTIHKDLVEVPKPEELNELFADKKISLSDFLTIAAKTEVKSSRPEHLQKKIKVISRCQEVIKSMSEDRKFNGRLCVKSLDKKNKTDIKYQSPLRRVPVIRFNFTSPMKLNEDYDAYAATIDRILLKSGITKEEINAVELSHEEATFKLIQDERKPNSKEKRFSCEECSKRKQREFFTVGTQCESSNRTVDIGVQASELDFVSSGKGLLKNDSIAYLTPAQLLNKEKAHEFASPEKNRDFLEQRGGFRKEMQSRSFHNTFGYDEPNFIERNQPSYNEPNFIERNHLSYDSSVLQSQDFDPLRFQQSMRHPRMFDDEQVRINQFQEGNASFVNFSGPYPRDRNLQRFGSRF